MRVIRHPDAPSFLSAAGDFLYRDEAENNLALGIAETLDGNPRYYGDTPPYFATVVEGGRTVGAVLRTPPHNLLLTRIPEAALGPVGEDVEAAGMAPLPGVIGPVETAAAFARVWCGSRGLKYGVKMAERVHSLDRIDPPPPAPGGMRAAREGDAGLLAEWWKAFMEEAAVDDHIPDVRRHVETRLGRIFVWDDGGPVSMAAWCRPTRTAASIAPVYTPPGFRGRGYASNCVAALSAQLLAGGRRFICIFTDLANPVSNSIYRKVGFRPVCDVTVYEFKEGRGG